MNARDLRHDAAEWPPGLGDLDPGFFAHAPRVRGVLPDPARPAIAIVGARECGEEARTFARDLAFDLSLAGVVVWSGGAKGIDRAAHEGALEARCPTVAVLGGGIARLSPSQNIDLFERIVAEGGALVSPFLDDVPAGRAGFLHRNRVLAAAVRALVVVECHIKSGARSAAAAARGLRRPVGVVPFAPWDGRGAGNRLELTDARAVPIFGARDVIGLLAPGEVSLLEAPAPSLPVRPSRAPRSERHAPLPAARVVTDVSLADPVAREIFALLESGPQHIDALGVATRRSASEVSRALFELAVEGLAHDAGAGNWRRLDTR